MTGLVQALIVYSIAVSLVFVVSLSRPRGPVGWMLAGWGWTAIAFESLLLLATFHVPVPAWVAVLVLLTQDMIFTWRLVLLWRSRRPDTVVSDNEKGQQ